MAVSILDIDDFESDDFNIIAIHTSLEDYKLAYLINKYCQINLIKEPKPLTLSKFDLDTNFEFFTFYDENEKVNWSLISNKSVLSSICCYTTDLCLQEVKTFSEILLVPECQEVDFFLKVDEFFDHQILKNLIIKLSDEVKEIQKIYEINKTTLVSINNLLF